jgi:hypothetical protein
MKALAEEFGAEALGDLFRVMKKTTEWPDYINTLRPNTSTLMSQMRASSARSGSALSGRRGGSLDRHGWRVRHPLPVLPRPLPARHPRREF